MTLQKPVCYSAISSLGFHFIFVLMAGSFWLSQTDVPILQKPFRLKMVAKIPPPPPPVKREELREVRAVQKHVAPIKPVVMPEPQLIKEVTKTAMVHKKIKQTAVSSVAPRTLEPFDTLKANAAKTEKRVRVAPGVAQAGASFAAPRSLKSFGNAGVGKGKAKRVTRFQGEGTLAVADFAAPHSLKSFGNAGVGKGKAKRVTRFQGKGTLAVADFAAPHKLTSFGHPASGGKDGMVARIQKEVSRIGIPPVSPRDIPADFVDRGATRGYLAGVRRKIDSAKEYPRVAKNSGQQGKVRVRFTILQNGHIRDLQLLAGTPYRILNEEALEMIKRAVPFSRLPDTIGMASLEVILPFTFQLN